MELVKWEMADMGSLWETTHKDIWEDICFFTHRHRWQCLELAVGT